MPRFVFALLVGSLAVAAPVPKSVKKVETFDGTWELVQQNNNNVEVAKLSPWRWEIDGEAIFRHWGNSDGTFRREKENCWFVKAEGGQPGDMDYVTGYDRKGTAYRTRAVVTGDEMVVCWQNGRDRPKELKPGPGVDYYRFKRIANK